MIISAIAAMGKNRVIGKDNKLLWHLPLELKYFKATTLGHHLIMGRKTFESGPPLPNRTSIVLTNNDFYEVPMGCLLARSPEEALNIAKKRGEKEVFVSGGAAIYTLMKPWVQKLYLTTVETDATGDAYFPDWDLKHWQLLSEHVEPVGKKNSIPWTSRIYLKK